MNETVNLHLPQWEATDRIHHDDFNDAFAAIDTAVAASGNCHIYTGSYEGDGTSGRTIDLGFTPKLLIVFGYYGESNKVAILFLTQNGQRHVATGTTTIETGYTTLNGSRLTFSAGIYGNVRDTTNYYIAFV